MATSSLSICNDALVIIGCDPISDLTNDVKEARLCSEQYAKVRDQLIAAHPWNFSTSRLEIASDADLPSGYANDIWGFAFSLPADCLRVFALTGCAEDEPWKVESGKKLFANFDPVNIKYAKQITDTTVFSRFFEEALAYQLAARICYAITQKTDFTTAIKEEAKLVLSNSRSYDAQEGALDVVEAEDWIRSRY